MTERVGNEVQGDATLLAYAKDLWASSEYWTWRDHMRRDVADSLGSTPQGIEDYPAEA